MDGVLRPYAFAGPEGAFILSATDSYSAWGGTPQGLLLVTYSPDAAIDFVGGAEFNVTPKLGITAEVRYSWGLVNLINWEESYQLAIPHHETRTSGVQLLIGAMFHVT